MNIIKLFLCFLTTFSSFTCFSWEEFKSQEIFYKVNENHTEMIIEKAISNVPEMLNFSQTFPALQQITFVGDLWDGFDAWNHINDDLGIGDNSHLRVIKYEPLRYANSSAGVWYLLQSSDLPDLETLIYKSNLYNDHSFLKFTNLKNIYIDTNSKQISPFLEDLLFFNKLENVNIAVYTIIQEAHQLSRLIDLELIDMLANEKPNLNIDINFYIHYFYYEPKGQEDQANEIIDMLNSQFQGTNIHFYLKSFTIQVPFAGY